MRDTPIGNGLSAASAECGTQAAQNTELGGQALRCPPRASLRP